MRENHFLLGRVAIAALAIVSALVPVACGSILGLDDGLPRVGDSDASGSDDATTGPDGSADARTGPDGSADGASHDARGGIDSADADATGDALDAAEGDAGEGGGRPDAGSTDGGDACAPDPNWCTTHCRSGPDNCGANRDCINNCSPNWTCDVSTNSCVCQRDPTWCSGRCGVILDNCGVSFDCNTCDGGTACTKNTCGCAPLGNPCAMRQCGQVLDSCNHPVTCGVNGTCAGGGVCDPDAGTCCTPLTNPCAGQCGTVVDDGCGQPIACPAGCPYPEVCNQTTCCKPNPQCGSTCNVRVPDGCGNAAVCSCAGNDLCYQGQCCTPTPGCSPTCVGNCGQPAPCCGPPDGGGGCSVAGGQCPNGPGDCCPGLSCNATMACVPSCSKTSCASLSDCCFGYTVCAPTIVPNPDGGPIRMGPGMCQ